VFWTIAAALLFVGALITLSPLLRVKSLWQPVALALVFLVPAGAAWLYTDVGTPAAIHLAPVPSRAAASAADPHSSEAQQMDSMIASLRSKLAENPDDLDGWMLLARSLRATQQFEDALEALETADRLSPGNPYIMTDTVETRIYMTPGGKITPEMVATLKQALELQPGLQKALWLLGIASSQDGDNAMAITYWETLLEGVEPGSNVAKSVEAQINAAKTQMGMSIEEPPAAPADDGSWPGIQLSVRAGDEEQSRIPAGGVLYVMIRSPGPAMGPPIGVRRIIDPRLPLEITITDQDSMLKERQISAETEVQLQARISLTGSPAANTGDWQSAPIIVSLESTENVELVIDQRVE